MTFDPNRPAAPEPFTPAASEPPALPTTPVAAAPPVMATPPFLPVARKASPGGRWLNVALALAVAVAIGGVAFAIGRGTAPVGNGPGGPGGPGGAGFPGLPGFSFAPGASGQPGSVGGLGGPKITVRGTVESIDGDTLTIKTAAGPAIEVTTSASTAYRTESAASASDVEAGATVQVQLDIGGAGPPSASAITSRPLGMANSVTIIP